MPRPPRMGAANVCFHIINRGNARNTVFFKSTDYERFIYLIGEASAKVPIKLFSFCLMPNHFHLMLSGHHSHDMSRWMQWLLSTHVRRLHSRKSSSGHIWQGRYKSFPVEMGEHFLTVARYIHRNPVAAGLVNRSEEWRWSSVHFKHLVSPWPIEKPTGWQDWINAPQTEKDCERLQQSMRKGSPFGKPEWAETMAKQLGLENTLRPRGRPRKPEERAENEKKEHIECSSNRNVDANPV